MEERIKGVSVRSSVSVHESELFHAKNDLENIIDNIWIRIANLWNQDSEEHPDEKSKDEIEKDIQSFIENYQGDKVKDQKLREFCSEVKKVYELYEGKQILTIPIKGQVPFRVFLNKLNDVYEKMQDVLRRRLLEQEGKQV